MDRGKVKRREICVQNTVYAYLKLVRLSYFKNNCFGSLNLMKQNAYTR